MSHKHTLQFHYPLSKLQNDMLNHLEAIVQQGGSIPENLDFAGSTNLYYLSLVKAADVESADAFATAAAVLISLYAANQREVTLPPAQRKYNFAKVATALMGPYIAFKEQVDKCDKYDELMAVFKDLPMPPTPMHTNEHRNNLAKLGYHKGCYEDAFNDIKQVRKLLNVGYDKKLPEAVADAINKSSKKIGAATFAQVEALERELDLTSMDALVGSIRFGKVIERVREIVKEQTKYKGIIHAAHLALDGYTIHREEEQIPNEVVSLVETLKSRDRELFEVRKALDKCCFALDQKDLNTAVNSLVSFANEAYEERNGATISLDLLGVLVSLEQKLNIPNAKTNLTDRVRYVYASIDKLRHDAKAFDEIRKIVDKSELLCLNDSNTAYIEVVRSRFDMFVLDSPAPKPSLVVEPDGMIESYITKTDPTLTQLGNTGSPTLMPKVKDTEGLSNRVSKAESKVEMLWTGAKSMVLGENESAVITGVTPPKAPDVPKVDTPTDLIAHMLTPEQKSVHADISNLRKNMQHINPNFIEKPKPSDEDKQMDKTDGEYAAIHETRHADGTVTRSYITKTPEPESQLEVERDYYKNRCQELEELLFAERAQNNC